MLAVVPRKEREVAFAAEIEAVLHDGIACVLALAELDLAARAWLDTIVNSQEEIALRRGDRCRIVWSAKAFGKEPSP